MLRIPAVTASLALVVAGLGGCALFEDVGDGDLDDALELVPGDATSVVFRQGSAGASLALRLEQNLEQDVAWQVTARADSGRFRAYKMNDDLDLDAVGDDLADAGYGEGEVAGHRHFSPEDPADHEVVLVPDEHLMLVGQSPDVLEKSLDVLDDDADSLTDSGTFDDVLADVDDPDFAVLAKDPECAAARAGQELGTPESMGFFRFGDTETSSVLVFEDDDAAEADLEAREAYLDEGHLERTQQPLADIATWDQERDDNVVRINYQYDDPALAVRAAQQYDGFHVCHAE